MTKHIDLTGRKFGRLTVIGFSHTDKYKFWNCECICGKTTKVPTGHLNNGHTTSCGCYGQSVARKHKLNETFFENIDSEEKAYWLGFIAADGNVHKNKKQFQIALQARDVGHLEKLKRDIGSSHGIFRHKENSMGFSVKNKEFCSHLIRHGIVPRKTKSLVPPEIDENLQRHFWRGMVDGDGTVYTMYKKHRCCEAVLLTGTESIILGFVDFLHRFGILTKTKPRKHPESSGIFVINLSGGKQVGKIVDLLYKDSVVFLDRKKDKAREVVWARV